MVSPRDFLRPLDSFERRHPAPPPREVDRHAQDSRPAFGCRPRRRRRAGRYPARPPRSICQPRSANRPRSPSSVPCVAEHLPQSYIGMGYYGTLTPRGHPCATSWRTPAGTRQYTPYQAGDRARPARGAAQLPDGGHRPHRACQIANASLLDEGTAAAEAMAIAPSRCTKRRQKRAVFFVAERLPPADDRRGADPRRAAGHRRLAWGSGELRTMIFAGRRRLRRAGAVPDTTRHASATSAAGRAGACGRRAGAWSRPICWRLTLLTPPGRVGGRHRGGLEPSASACRWATADRTRPSSRPTTSTSAQMPGRIIGVSKRRARQPAPIAWRCRPASSTSAATRPRSNICTAQVLLARHGLACTPSTTAPKGLKRIAQRVHASAHAASSPTACKPRRRHGQCGAVLRHPHRLATAALPPRRSCAPRGRHAHQPAPASDDGTRRHLRSMRRTHPRRRLRPLLAVLRRVDGALPDDGLDRQTGLPCDPHTPRTTSAFLTAPRVQQVPHEHEMLRYIQRLEAKRPVARPRSMISLGSCTMKLNATRRDVPGDLAGVRPSSIPSAPPEQARRLRPACSPTSSTWLRRDHRFRRRLAPAQRRLAGRIRRPAGHPRLSTQRAARVIATSA